MYYKPRVAHQIITIYWYTQLKAIDTYLTDEFYKRIYILACIVGQWIRISTK